MSYQTVKELRPEHVCDWFAMAYALNETPLLPTQFAVLIEKIQEKHLALEPCDARINAV